MPSWRFGRRNDKKSAQSAHHHRVQWLRTAAVFGFGDLFDAIRCNSQRKNHLIISRAAACGNLAPGLQKRLACALRLNSIRKLKSDMSPKVRFEPHFIPLERRRMLDEFMCPQHNHLARFDKCSFSAIPLMMSALSAFFSFHEIDRNGRGSVFGMRTNSDERQPAQTAATGFIGRLFDRD